MPEIRTSVLEVANLKKEKNSFMEKFEKAKAASM